MAVGFNHPKLSLHVEDGFKFMQQHEQAFDVVITDSSDPVGNISTIFFSLWIIWSDFCSN